MGLRGRLFATRQVLGAGLGMVGGGVVATVLRHLPFPQNFALLFFLAFVVMMCSYVFLVLLKETEDSPRAAPLSSRNYLTQLPQMLRQQSSYRRFLVADALLMTTTMASAFYTVNAFRRFSLSDAYAGTFTMVMMSSSLVGNLFFGYLADRLGHKTNLVVAVLATAVSCVLAIKAPNPRVYCLVFVGASLAAGLMGISRLSIIAEFASEAERPTYIALTNMLTSWFALSGVAAGWIADHMGMEFVFALTAILGLSAAAWLMKCVEEPRGRHHLPPEGRAVTEPWGGARCGTASGELIRG